MKGAISEEVVKMEEVKSIVTETNAITEEVKSITTEEVKPITTEEVKPITTEEVKPATEDQIFLIMRNVQTS